MRLRNKNEGLSDSLLNNSQIDEDNNSNEQQIKSQMLIRTLKTPNVVFNKKEVLKNIDESKNIAPPMAKPKRSRKHKADATKISTNDISNNSISDIILPKRQCKVQSNARASIESNKISLFDSSSGTFASVISSKATCEIQEEGEVQNKSRQSKTRSIELINKNSSKFSSENNNAGNFSKNSVSSKASNIGSFKTPIIPKRKSSRSLKSPMFASSPKPELKKSKSNSEEPSNSNDDLFSSQIISSSEDFQSYHSVQSLDISKISPIKKPASSVDSIQKIKPIMKKKISKSLQSKPRAAKRIAENKSLPLFPESPVYTRSGRESRSVSQTKLATKATRG